MPNGENGKLQEAAIGVLKVWHLFAIMGSLLIAVATILFHAGSVDANIETRQARTESDISDIRFNYARNDVVDQRLKNIEQSESRVEAQVKDQGDILSRILQDSRRH